MFWYIDPSHTAVNFSVKHMMLSTVRGKLGKVRGRIELDPSQPEKGDFEIAVEVKGITTGDQKRDGHLASPDFFDAEEYPEITFKSNAVFPKGDGHYTASGDLTIREITRPVSFDVELLGVVPNGQGGQHLGAAATLTIDRSDFGLTEKEGLVKGRSVRDGKRRRRDYEITGAGRAVLRAWLREPPAPQPERNEMLLKVFFANPSDVGALGSFIAKADDIARADLDELRGIETSLKENYRTDPRLPYWLLTVRYGILGSEALRQWCKEALRVAESG